ncbi:MAG: hypothetical protein LBQ12_12860 [Deltaproteobacteria bacterium]|nr:hypothetical protein [Deltaproteobacteria bacterium]
MRKEARELLLTPQDPDETDGNAYLALVEKATVLLYRASAAEPADPAVFRELGRLSEIRALFTRDPWDRRELLDQAQFQFARAARLEFETAFDQRALSYRAPAAASPSAPAAPIISELAFAGRLRRGEATLDELAARHASENLPAERNPRYWADMLYIVQAGEDAAARQKLYSDADGSFAELWRTMPAEVPWRGLPRQGPQKIRKIEVLEAWSGTALALSGSETDPELRSSMFYEALRLLELGVPLPLDSHETQGLLGSLDRAEQEAPDREASSALWALKDKLFTRWLASKDRPAEANALWGDDFYARADRQLDSRLFDHYVAEGDLRYAAYIEEIRASAAAESERAGEAAAAAREAALKAAGENGPAGARARKKPQPQPGPEDPAAALKAAESVARAFFRQGEALELKTGRTQAFLVSLSREELDARRRRILAAAAAGYRQALDLSPASILYSRSLSRAYLGLASLAPAEDAFLPYFEQSLALALSSASREPDSGGAFFGWGKSLMAALETTPGPAARERLTAEALAAFRQNLRSHSPFVPELNEMADFVYRAAREAPGQSAQAYRLLAEICRRLSALRPDDPDARFALALALLMKISAETPGGGVGANEPPPPGPAAQSAEGGGNGNASPGGRHNGGSGGNLNGSPDGNRNGRPNGSRNGTPEINGQAPAPGNAVPGGASARNSHGPEGAGGAAPGAFGAGSSGAPPLEPRSPETALVTGGQGGPGAAAAPPGLEEGDAPAGPMPQGSANLPAPWNPGPWNGGARNGGDRRDFLELLGAAGEGLELVSLGEEPQADPDSDMVPDPLDPFRRDPARIRFLEPESFLRVTLSSSTRPERNASSLNSFASRLLDLAPPEGMGPWHMLQLASFLRRSAATGYLPPEEEKAYFRLSLKFLSEAEGLLRTEGRDSELLSFVLAEKGLAFAESSLGDGGKGEGAELAAKRLWDEADSIRRRSSGYARARWAAWSGSLEELRKHLLHSARDEDLLLWPKFREALLEPSFRAFRTDGPFKSLWFGYSR